MIDQEQFSNAMGAANSTGKSENHGLVNLVEKNNQLRNELNRLFDNPLRREFLTFEQVVDFFGYSAKWVRQQMAEGNLPYHAYGRSKFLFYISDVRQAILSGKLAPIRKVQEYDRKQKNTDRNKVSRSDQGTGGKTLEDLRNEGRRSTMDQFGSLS